MFAIQRQEEINTRFQSRGEDVSIFGINNPALGSDFARRRALHQFELKGSELLVEAQERISPQFLPDVALGFEKYELASDRPRSSFPTHL